MAAEWMKRYDSKLAAFRSGWDAYIEGVPMSLNPHTTHSLPWIEWRRGFTEAHRAEIDKQHDPGPVQLAFEELSPENKNLPAVKRGASHRCLHCGQLAWNLDGIIGHLWVMHTATGVKGEDYELVKPQFSQENDAIGNFTCDVCGQGAASEAEIRYHLEHEHGPELSGNFTQHKEGHK
jgi:hypothetical protein